MRYGCLLLIFMILLKQIIELFIYSLDILPLYLNAFVIAFSYFVVYLWLAIDTEFSLVNVGNNSKMLFTRLSTQLFVYLIGNYFIKCCSSW